MYKNRVSQRFPSTSFLWTEIKGGKDSVKLDTYLPTHEIRSTFYKILSIQAYK